MKESNFYSDEFEQLIREKTEQYKMYPSENVWKGVHNSLHTKRKWFIGSMSVLVTGILFFSGKELLTPSHPLSHKLAAAGTAATDSFNSDPARSGQAEDIPHANFVRLHPVSTTAASGRHLAAGVAGGEPEETDQLLNHLAITISHPVVSQPDLSELLSHAVRLPGEAPSLIESSGTPAVAMDKVSENPQSGPGLLDSWLIRNAPDNQTAHRNAESIHNNAETLRESGGNIRETAEVAGSKETGRDLDNDDAYVRGVIESLSAKGQHHARTSGEIAPNPSARQGSVAGKIKDSAGAAKADADAIGEESDLSRVNWLHDYAVYSLPPTPSRGRLFFQLTLAPTVNYRNLSGGTLASAKELTGAIGTVRPGDVQSWVDRTPALGFEFGANVLYRVTRNLTIKGGLQFNYTRYKMLAFSPQQPQQPLQNQTAGNSNNSNNSSYLTQYGNRVYLDSIAMQGPAQGQAQNPGISDNTVQATLYNDYYQLSAPIGFDLRILGNERLQFNIGATIQPSYLFNTDSYVLSSDYTSYTREPSAFRRWNLAGGVEAFLTYQSGPIRWQIGPEFRYQLFSNYLSGGSYPISENLKGYGFKIGMTKPLP
jgi:hypothetical protein